MIERVIITGSRELADTDGLRRAIDSWISELHIDTDLVVFAHGCCPLGGADTIFEELAVERGYRVAWFSPDDYGTPGDRSRFIRRNAAMVSWAADVGEAACFAFPSHKGLNRGTRDTYRRARNAGLIMRHIKLA